MKNIVLLFLLSCQISFSQTTINGSIKKSIFNNPIPYVNIGIINKSTGTVTDTNGDFVLKIADKYLNGFY